MSPRAAVVGAGIGGLTAAVALRRAGWEVSVLERAERLAPAGAGIALWPNAQRALAALGLAEAVEAVSARGDGAALYTSAGRRLGGSLADELPGRYGLPVRIAHRADLQASLLDALAGTDVRPGTPVTDARALDADLVVGADGLRSVVREAVAGEAPLTYSGLTAWRGVARADPDGLAHGERLGTGQIFGLAPLPGGRVYWWASARVAEDAPVDLGERFAGWAEPVAALLAATPADQVIRTPLWERPPASPMARDGIALVGDAAHPMLPNLGQGGGLAIEDAAVLGRVLAEADGDLARALARYAELREPRARRVVRDSKRMAGVVHLANPVAVRLRNTVLRATPARAAARRLGPVVGYDAATAT